MCSYLYTRLCIWADLLCKERQWYNVKNMLNLDRHSLGNHVYLVPIHYSVHSSIQQVHIHFHSKNSNKYMDLEYRAYSVYVQSKECGCSIHDILWPPYPNVLQKTKPSIVFHDDWHIEPHTPLIQTSGLPSCSMTPSTSRTSPLVHSPGSVTRMM